LLTLTAAELPLAGYPEDSAVVGVQAGTLKSSAN
jgi:hypothetical protein